MRLVARWGLVSALGAPAALIGGFTVAGLRQGQHFNACVSTISALAAPHAVDAWIMTCALYIVGGCHMATACALRSARFLGRVALATGGIATVGVAAFPTGATATPLSHSLAAGAAFGALAIWPALACQKDPAHAIFRTRTSLLATAALLLLLVWFAIELSLGSVRVGLAERAAAVGQALWPLAVVIALVRSSTKRLYATGP